MPEIDKNKERHLMSAKPEMNSLHFMKESCYLTEIKHNDVNVWVNDEN